MYRERRNRPRSKVSEEASQQNSTSKNTAPVAATGNMSDCKQSSERLSKSPDPADSKNSQKAAAACRDHCQEENNRRIGEFRQKIISQEEDISVDGHQSSSHFAVIPVNDTDSVNSCGKAYTSQDGRTQDFYTSHLDCGSNVNCSVQYLESSCILGETQIYEEGSEMGNTHWSHSYTGVRQPVTMRPSCRSDAAELGISDDLNDLYVPIVGYEMMEQRAKFTVFKLHVQKNAKESWFIFRRYTDFVRLNDQLQYLFPNFRLALPPKRWFGNNFDPMFLEDRQLGLQAFLNNICGHKDIVQSDCVREFLCVDDPPGPHDSIEESRALCESLEETVYTLRKDLAERDRKIETLSEELSRALRRIEELTMQQMMPDGQVAVSSSGSEATDVDRQSCAEADQQDYTPDQEEEPIVSSFSDAKPSLPPIQTKGDTPPAFTAIPLDSDTTQNSKDASLSALVANQEVIQVT